VDDARWWSCARATGSTCSPVTEHPGG